MRFYHKTLLNYFFVRQHIDVIESERIVSFLFVVHYSSMISVLHEHDDEKIQQNLQRIDFGQLFEIYRQIWRPYDILLNNQSFQKHAFIIPLIYLILIIIDFLKEIFYAYYEKESYNQFDERSKRSLYNKIVIRLIQTYNLIFSIWFIDFCMISLIYCQQNFQLLYFSLSIITLILIVVVQIFTILCSESIEFPCSPIHYDKISSFQYYNIILIIVLTYLNNKNFIIKETIRHTANLFIFGTSLYIEIFKIQKSKIHKICLVILAYTLIHNFTSIFFEYFLDQNYKVALDFALFPLLTNLILKKSYSEQQLSITPEANIQNIYKNLTILNFLSKKNNQKEKGYLIFIQAIQLLSPGVKDIFSCQLQNFNEKILQLHPLDQSFWYLKYLYVKFSLKQMTETLIFINQFRQNLSYSEVNQKFIKNQVRLSNIEKFKLTKLAQNIYSVLQDNLKKNSLTNNTQLEGILKEGIYEDEMKQQLADLLKKKLEIYQEMLNNKSQKENYFFDKLYQLLNQAFKFEKSIKDKLASSKSHFLNTLLIILYVHFFNNILQAELLKYYQLDNDDLKINLFDQMEMLKLKLSSDLVHFSIQYFSSRLFHQLGYNKNSDKSSLQFKSFFADNFKNQHNEIVLEFLETGKCKFLCGTQQEVIIRGNQNIYYFAYFQINFDSQIQSELIFNSFIEVFEDQPEAILLNHKNEIIGFTKVFEAKIRNQNYQVESILFKNIKLIIPNFKIVANDEVLKAQIFNNLQSCILKVKNIYNIFIIIIQNELNEGMLDTNYDNSQNKEPLLYPISYESLVQIPNNFDQEFFMSPLSFHKEEIQEIKLILPDLDLERVNIQSDNNDCKIQSSIYQANNNKKYVVKEDDHDIENDNGSSKFSRGFLDNSIYFQKYQRLNQFVNQQSKTSFAHKSIILMMLGFLINIIYQLIINFQIIPKFESVNKDADLISIKANFMTPVHNCVTAQVCVVDYILLAYAYKQVDEKIALQKLLFGYDSILKAYNHLKESFATQINNVNLQEFFNDESIQMYQQHNLTLIPRNISLKNALIYYYEAQYFVTIINYYAVLSYTPSNEFVYYISNIVTMDDYMDKLNTQLTDFIIYNISNFEDMQLKLFFKMLFLEIIIFSQGLCYLVKNQKNISHQFQQITSLSQYGIIIEQQSLKELIGSFSAAQTLNNFQFDLTKFEKNIQNYGLIQQKSQKINQCIYKPTWKIIAPTILIIILYFIIPQAVVQQSNEQFFTKLRNSAKQLFQLSQLSSAVTAIYEIRETSYMISGKTPFFEFYTDQKRLDQNLKVVSELSKIKEFLTTFPYIDYNSMLIENDFNDLLTQMADSNICKYLIHYNQTLAEEHCEKIYDGVMLLGLMNTISKIYSQISTEYQNTNGFEYQLRGQFAAFEESEIGLITSDVVLALQQKFYHGLISKTNEVIQIYKTLTAIYICISFLSVVILLYFYFPYLIKQAMVVRNMIFIVPSLQLYLDQDFDLKLRKMVKQNK